MADTLPPRPGQLIAAAAGSALLCMPIYVSLSAVSMYVSGWFGGGYAQTSVLDFLGSMLILTPFSLVGIMIWPISLLVAVAGFALVARWLTGKLYEQPASRWTWAGAGAVVGLLTGIAMSLEAAWRSSDLFPEHPSFGGLAFAIPTGILGGLICRRIIRHLMRGPGCYAPNRF